MAIQLPPRDVLTGRHVVLEPLTWEHVDGLLAALHRPETFAGGWGGGPAAYSPEPADFVEHVRRLMANDRPYAVRLAAGRDAGTLVGTSSLAEFEPAKERTHLGWTAYDPRVWGTAVNPETKLLLLGHAFGHGWGRVKLQSDAANERSVAAIGKLGATREGVTRRDQRRADGSWRDAVVFSVIIDDWPRVREGLQQRVDAADVPVLTTEPAR